MRKIAITGGIACGKTTVATTLAEFGATLINTDTLSHLLTSAGGEGVSPIQNAFGDYVINEDGSVNRMKLGQIVFSNATKLAELNSILHPLIEKITCEEIERCRIQGEKLVFIDIPLLFEANMQHLADTIVCVSVSSEIQKSRIIARDSLSEDEAVKRIQSQLPLSEKEAMSDIVIRTDDLEPPLLKRLKGYFEQWLKEDKEVNA